jgi:uncharacterized membrane protein
VKNGEEIHMMDDERRAKRPATVLAGPYGHPLHPVLVTIPIGAWVASFVFDIASRVADDGSPYVVGSRLLIIVGLLGAVSAAMIGALDLVLIPTHTPAFRTAITHATLNLTVTGAYLVNLLIRGGDDERVAAGLLALSAVSLAVLSASGFLGGRLAFRYGVRVVDDATQSDGFMDQRSTAWPSRH